MRVAPAFCALVLSGCHERFVVLDAPDDVQFLAGIRLDASGKLLASTPLRVSGTPLELTDESPDWYVVGWRAATFDARTIATPSPLSDLAVEVAQPCGPQFPPPDYVGSVGISRVEPSTVKVPVLTSPWLEASCPEDFLPPVLTTPCEASSCEKRFEREGCSVRVDVSACDAFFSFRQPVLRGGIRQDGTVCIDTAGCERLDEDTLECQGRTEAVCTIELEMPPKDSLEVRTVRLVDGPPVPPDDLTTAGLGPWQLRVGYLSDLVAIEDRVFAIRHWGTVAKGLCSTPSEELVALDSESLEVARTTTMAPCARSLVPEGQSFVALTGYGESSELQRFDLQGRVLARQNLGLGPEAYASDVTRLGADWRVVARLGPGDAETVFIDVASDLRSRAASKVARPAGTRNHVELLYLLEDEGTTFGADDHGNDLVWYGQSGEITASIHLQGFIRFAAPTRLSDGKIVVGYIGVGSRILFPNSTRVGVEGVGSVYFEWPADSTALTPWGEDLLVAQYPQTADLHPALITLFDSSDRRYVSRGREVSVGPVGRARTSEDGTVWLMSAWSGDVTRVRAQ